MNSTVKFKLTQFRVPVDSEFKAQAKARALALGISVAEYIRNLIAADLRITSQVPAHGANLRGLDNAKAHRYTCLRCKHEWVSVAAPKGCPQCAGTEFAAIEGD